MQPADIIWKQLTIQTKMAIGAREPSKSNNGNTLTFKVTITRGQAHWIKVTYTPDDLYNVELVHARGSKITTQRSCEGIYNDNLNEVIYNYCHNK